MKRARRQDEHRSAAAEGRLLARPGQPRAAAAVGLQPLGLATRRDGFLHVPSSYDGNHPMPLVLMLHGAGGTAQHSLPLLQQLADQSGFILLVPDSRDATWDVIRSAYGPDIAFIDDALGQTFSRYVIDPAHIAVGGFSDGASYALSVGITNGDLFTHILAFSPGFMAPASQAGTPQIYISHGTHDQVLPIDRCSQRIVPQLEQAGYVVRYQEFDGPHTVPPQIAQEGVEWFMTKQG
ncbi:MAG: phospholipase [Herpetosiphonaceae bacterium]|nr:phospholipase [Herpetosiphonaceae bacterium]